MKVNKIIFISVFVMSTSIINSLDIQMVKIDGGCTTIGSDEFKIIPNSFLTREESIVKHDAKYPFKAHRVFLSDFYISRYEITIEQFKAFVDDTRIILSWQKEFDPGNSFFSISKNNSNNPMDFISAFEALMFCQWLSKTNNKTYRLPTNAEWEYTATKGNRMKFPWGNKPMLIPSTDTTDVVDRSALSVDQIPEDTSPFGVVGMYGGSEFVLDTFQYDFYLYSPKSNPISLMQGENDEAISLRPGGSYNDFGDSIGVYWYKGCSFINWSRTNFRIVEDTGTIFNKGTEEECLFFQSQGVVTNGFIKLLPNQKKQLIDTITNKNVYILFKAIRDNKIWYKIYYEVMNNIGDYTFTKYKSGWIMSEEVILIDKPWYE